MATIDPTIVVDVAREGVAESAGFGLPLFLSAPGALGVGFTERLRLYTTAADIAADTDLDVASAAALTFGLSQSPSVAQVAVGRVDTLVPLVETLTFVYGADGDVYTVAVNGISVEYTAVALDDADAVALALNALLVTALAAEPVTPTFALNVITLTSTSGFAPFTSTSGVVGTGTITHADSTPAVSPSSELALIFAEDSSWYALATDPAGYPAASMINISVWALANKRWAHFQLNDSEVVDKVAGNIAEILGAASYKYSTLNYHSSDTVYFSWGLLCDRLSVDPDTDSTTWDRVPMEGIAADVALTSTQIANLNSLYVGYYSILRKRSVTANIRTMDGGWADERLTDDWIEARQGEGVADVIINASARGSKIPFTDAGLILLSAPIEKNLSDGQAVGHLNPDVPYTITVPRASSLTPAQKASRSATIKWTATRAGAIHDVAISGVVNL